MGPGEGGRMKKVFYCSCNEIKCPDYYYCWFENANGRMNKCEKREQEIEEDKLHEDFVCGRESSN